MAIFKKNIWLIFYVLALTATLFFFIISYFKWQNTYLKYQTSQENIVELMANATYSLFDTQERLMDILGVTLREDEHYLYNFQGIEKHVNSLLQNPDVLAFGVTTPEGDFIYGSSHKDPTKIPNIANQPDSRDSFSEALSYETMVFGRTYFSPAVQKWAMPIRKTVRDEQGRPLFVMTTLFKLTSTFDRLINSVRHRQNLIVSIIRDSDLFQQYNSLGQNEYNLTYQTPFPKASMERMFETIFDIYHLTPHDLKKDEPLVSFRYQDGQGVEYLTSIKYNKTYKLWIVVHTYVDTIIEDFLQTLALYFAVFITSGGLFFFLFHLIANAEEKRRNDLLYQATYDQLTTLPNRSYLHQNIFNWAYKNAPAFSLFYIDMDHFKNINDSFGHQFGDYVLVEIAKRLKGMLPVDADVIRYGGDEFVMMTHLCERQELLFFATQLIEALSRPYDVQELHFNIGASIGIAIYPDHGQSLDMLLRASDIALYESKKIKNSAHIFANAMQEGFLKNVHIEQELRKAMAHHELFMVYQPQMDIKGSVYGVEALIRWNSPNLGLVPPNDFIPLAEASGLMPKIGRFIVETVCLEIQTLHKILQHLFQVSINISVRQFMDAGFLEHLLQTIEQTQLRSLSITLEVTENLFIEDVHALLPLLEQIKAMGIHISMDDFGTGYSSLSMLRKLPIDELKIDKSFVDEMFEDDAAQKMVQNIIAIGKNFGMHIVAEGVETKEQKELLSAFGCDRFQGYYFAKPLPKEDLLKFLQENSFTCNV
ncbi:EAL domain-containing protein [Sulfurospirillum halorespirans]|uniref:EAL domain-containing diguanylate cyclase n=1 Tax=Sulfurospirillum halorespirans DSM 13726 TaxID=1193502 RepID=A0A1D7TLM9_9BACT|nr:EAL domain-containing protein [Sulfurospirillum halorespirans]AOO65892.1 EAL domain-containing diguanylate cyclase [Sulfurospirillum halorespirans DSM 13726]